MSIVKCFSYAMILSWMTFSYAGDIKFLVGNTSFVPRNFQYDYQCMDAVKPTTFQNVGDNFYLAPIQV